jgi:hypothetical protein
VEVPAANKCASGYCEGERMAGQWRSEQLGERVRKEVSEERRKQVNKWVAMRREAG